MADYNFKDYSGIFKSPTSSAPSSFDWSAASNLPPLVDNIFEGRAPSFNSWADIASDLTPYTAQYAYSDPSQSRRSDSDWIMKGFEALNKALSYKNQSASGGTYSRRERTQPSVANAGLVGQGRGYSIYTTAPTQKTTQTGGSRGFGGTVGSILGAGLGLALAPATGGASAAIGAAGLGSGLGGQLGSLFG
jgi:hypothetical protein